MSGAGISAVAQAASAAGMRCRVHFVNVSCVSNPGMAWVGQAGMSYAFLGQLIPVSNRTSFLEA